MFTKVLPCVAMVGLSAALCQCTLLFDLGALDETSATTSHDATDGRRGLDGASDSDDLLPVDENNASGDGGSSNDGDDDKVPDDTGLIGADGAEANTGSDAPSEGRDDDSGDGNDAEATACPSSWLSLAGVDAGVAAYASSTVAGNPPMNAIDGNFTTRWESGPVPAPQYIYLDFGAGTQVSIERVQIIWGGATCAKDYRLEVSNNGGTWTTVWKLPSPNTVGTATPPPANTAWALYAVDSPGISAQAEFLRVYLTASCGDGYSIWEMRVFGHRLPCR